MSIAGALALGAVEVSEQYDLLDSVACHQLTRGARSFYFSAPDRQGELRVVLPVYLQHTVDPFAVEWRQA